ncbi:GNAT family N-acetyltransferase [Clostridium tagluense]|uniref:GNAT family N-acetyltransferase n=1 Tax=Clostridium tagluense TaxID=360422 RepID=UPI001CF3B207|nr:GNAT family N-acetyltransferase [Clostridium tagluense]MCB2310459.1 GNAT family N-acetyltransferase [Clostridium tagluense]MCB2315375.1 GNAT family N-acetyltransferase [Clostridium tagluense]MCB2320226.1 GNAT family N-acetyltransferase [Clostridium tagluense]MCB2325117.1 GNAT family N-acetyltransferase [Clostridium tagluense]MCB2329969.1 GNAT family N-acetyltransferase [Clostridium tagluense]
MVDPSDGKNFYCLIYNNDDIPVGEVSFHRFDAEEKKADFNIKIQSKYRSKEYAKEAISLEKGKKALQSFGFNIVSRSDSEILFKMTKERFIELQGVHGC